MSSRLLGPPGSADVEKSGETVEPCLCSIPICCLEKSVAMVSSFVAFSIGDLVVVLSEICPPGTLRLRSAMSHRMPKPAHLSIDPLGRRPGFSRAGYLHGRPLRLHCLHADDCDSLSRQRILASAEATPSLTAYFRFATC